MKRADSVRVTTFVGVSPIDAFDVFTRETDLWWGRGPRFRFGGRAGILRFEPGTGGRLVESFEDGSAFEVGKVLTWEEGARLVFEWRSRNFGAGELTVVEVLFKEKNGGTEVVLEHRGWSALPDSHPVRHGQDDRAFADTIGFWWGDLMSSYRERAGSPPRG